MLPAGPQKGRHIDRWATGLFTNRVATAMPFRRSYGQTVQFYDALIGGLNVEISPENTLVRRPGWTAFNTVGYGGAAQSFCSAVLNGVQYDLLGTSTNVYQFTNSVLNSLFSKGTTAQTFFQQVGSNLFFSDGTNNKKWDGATVSNNGIAPPTTAPTVANLNLWDTVGASQTCHAWVPNAVYTNATANPQQYFLLAPTQEVQWAVVPPGATLKSQNSAPNWATGFGLFGFVTNDGTMTWVNLGTIKTWAANSTAFNASAYLTNAPTLASVDANGANASTSGSTTNNWIIGGVTAGFNAGASGNTNTLIIDTLGLSVPTGSTVTGVQVTLYRAGLRANMISDVTVQLRKAGVAAGNNKAKSGFWPVVKAVNPIQVGTVTIAQSAGTQTIYGSNTDLWGTSIAPADVASSGFGVQIVANSNAAASNAGAIYYPINITVTYKVSSSGITGTTTGSVVKDSNGNLQVVTVSGTTGAGPGQPAWSTTIGGSTTDNTVTWKNLGTANVLSALFQWTYAYGFHTANGAGTHLSTMSPLLTLQAPIVGPNVPVTGQGTDDTQCDSIDLYRTLDAGSLLLYDSSATNVNAATSWTITDTALDPSLNFLLIGPVALANNPPPAGMTILTYHMGRLWGAVGNKIFFSAGPDCGNGDGNQAWPPANSFPLESNVTGFASTTQGLVVYTDKDMSVVMGGPQTLSFWVQPLLQNFGILSPNCVTQEGDEIVIYTTQKQLWALSPNGKNELGFNVAPTLASTFASSTAYLTIHRNGQDQGIFICDASANSMRYNMNAESWDAVSTPAMGLGPVASIDLATSPASRALVTAVGGTIFQRNTTTFTDNGSPYAANAIVGSIVLSEMGEAPAMVESIFLESVAVGTALSVSVLPNEISGSFTSVPNPVNEPPQLPASSTINSKRYDWKNNQSALAQLVKHLQVKITMPSSDTVKNEVSKLAIQ